jgi:hypothetical protein
MIIIVESVKKWSQKGGLITHDEAIKEIINVDFPKIKEEAIKEAEQNGRLDIAEDLKRKERFGIDYVATNLISEEEEEERRKKEKRRRRRR